MLRLSRQAQMSQQARLHRAPVVTLVVLAMAMVIPRCWPHRDALPSASSESCAAAALGAVQILGLKVLFCDELGFFLRPYPPVSLQPSQPRVQPQRAREDFEHGTC